MLAFLKQFVFIQGKCSGCSHRAIKELSASYFCAYFYEALYQKPNISSVTLMSLLERVGVEFSPGFPAFWLSGMGGCVTSSHSLFSAKCLFMR